MFPYGYTADTFGGSNLFIAASFGKAETEDSLFLFGEMTCHELVNVDQPLVISIRIIDRLNEATAFYRG